MRSLTRRIGAFLATATVLAVCAVGVARSSPAPPLTAALVRYWTAVAKCETGGGGPPKWDWGSKHRPDEGALYEGGVGFSAPMWTLWAGELSLLARYPHAYDAPPLVQMSVAQYGATVHKAQWGCKP